MQRLLSILCALAGFTLVFNSCQNNSLPDTESSFGFIQSRILNTSCAISGCHATVNDDAFAQHGLVLTAAVAYQNLVNVESKNPEAQAAGLLRVKPGDAEESLLYHKLLASGHHTESYGSPMPLGLPLLSTGQVEFVRQWIEAGAPEKGQVADAALLDDKTYQPENFEPLTPPAAGTGLQVVIPPFSVAPDFERELFVYKKLGNTEDIFVNRIEIKMRQNSHHFILYDFNDQLPVEFTPALNFVRDIRNPDGSMNVGNMIPMGFHVFISGTQTPYFDYQLPEGVAIPFEAGAAIDFNSHYVNKSDKEIEGEVNINLFTVPAASVQHVAKTLNLANQNMNIPAGQEVMLTKTFVFDKKISVLSLTSHTHQLGKKFVIKIKGGARDGQVMYTSTDWHHPLYLNVDPPLVLNAGEGLTSEITYKNTTSKLVKFGLTSEDEMGIIFGYYIEHP